MGKQRNPSRDAAPDRPDEEEQRVEHIPTPDALPLDEFKVATESQRRGVSDAAQRIDEEEDLPDVLQNFANMRQRPVVYFLINEELRLGHAVRLWQVLDSRTFTELDVVIDSIGGDIHTAYQVVQLLRERTSRYNACVLLYAKSAATLLCLGAHTIMLHELAQLGPLDTQKDAGEIPGTNRTHYISALNDFKSLEELRQFISQALETATKTIQQLGPLPLETAIKCAVDVVRATTEPLFAKIDPQELGTNRRALSIGIEYGRRVLQRAGAGEANGNWQSTEICRNLEQLISRLVYDYPSHDHIIDSHELRAIGFRRASLFDIRDNAERVIVRDLFKYVAIREQRGTVIDLVDFVPAKGGGDAMATQGATDITMANGIPTSTGRPANTQPAHR